MLHWIKIFLLYKKGAEKIGADEQQQRNKHTNRDRPRVYLYEVSWHGKRAGSTNQSAHFHGLLCIKSKLVLHGSDPSTGLDHFDPSGLTH